MLDSGARRALRGIVVLFAVLFGGTVVRAQCQPFVQPGEGMRGANGAVRASVWWDPDGPGPLGPRAVFGGSFTAIGTVLANRIAAFDPATQQWSTFGSGLNGTVQALAVLPNGDLVAAGLFSDGASFVVRTVVRWTGSAWQPLGGVTNSGGVGIQALLVLANGDLVVGGQFTAVGATSSIPAANVARWDGANWHAMGLRAGAGAPLGVEALAVLSNGTLVAGGGSSVRAWNGTDWVVLGAPNLGSVHALAALPNGELLAGVDGKKQPPNPPVPGVKHWDGTAWRDAVGAPSVPIRCFANLPGGDIVCGGTSAAAGGNNLARWNGTGWSPLPPGIATGTIHTILPEASGDLLVGGAFATTGTLQSANLARHGGAGWSLVSGSGFGGGTSVMTVLQNGDLVTNLGPVLARWDGVSWTAYPAIGAQAPGLQCVIETSNGDLVVGGYATGGPPLWRWDGLTWTPLTPPTSVVYAVVEMANGDLAVAGDDGVDTWNGVQWSKLGGSSGLWTSDLVRLPNGDLVVAGWFTAIGATTVNYIARWDGSAWRALGTGTDAQVTTLAVTPTGDVIAYGGFTVAGGVPAIAIARWDGTGWHAMGAGLSWSTIPLTIDVLPDGDVLVGGTWLSSGSTYLNQLARWDGVAWSALGLSGDNFVYTARWMPSGVLAVGGTFTHFGGVVAPGFAAVRTTCPPATSALGAGCASSGGANLLTARTQPWADSTFRAEATGLPALSIAIAVTSAAALTPALALGSVFPSPPGCELHVAPDLLYLLLPAAGAVESSLFLPNTPPLVGVTLHHQLVVFEIDAAGAITEVTATNALSLTVGDV